MNVHKCIKEWDCEAGSKWLGVMGNVPFALEFYLQAFMSNSTDMWGRSEHYSVLELKTRF